MTDRRRHPLLYLLYLDSPPWRLRRRLWILGARGGCERCGSRRPLTIHRSYRRLGHERGSDVEVLCWPCHRSEHGGGPTHLPLWRRRFVRAALLALAVLLAAQLLWAVAHGVPHR